MHAESCNFKKFFDVSNIAFIQFFFFVVLQNILKFTLISGYDRYSVAILGGELCTQCFEDEQLTQNSYGKVFCQKSSGT